MGDKIKTLRRENDELKKQMRDLTKDFQAMRDKMAERSEAAMVTSQMPNEQDVQFLSDGYDILVQSKESMLHEFQNLKKRLETLSTSVNRIDKAIDDIQLYSYQYNLKIVGVPQQNERENSEETANLCLNLFTGIGTDISMADIDIAHRVSLRNPPTHGGRRQPNPIICKFVRRLARENVLAARNNTARLTADDLELPSSAITNRIAIFSHLTPRLQDLLYEAKTHQSKYGYKFCWTKNSAIFLRKTDNSRVIRLQNAEDLDKLKMSEPTAASTVQSDEPR